MAIQPETFVQCTIHTIFAMSAVIMRSIPNSNGGTTTKNCELLGQKYCNAVQFFRTLFQIIRNSQSSSTWMLPNLPFGEPCLTATSSSWGHDLRKLTATGEAFSKHTRSNVVVTVDGCRLANRNTVSCTVQSIGLICEMYVSGASRKPPTPQTSWLRE